MKKILFLCLAFSFACKNIESEKRNKMPSISEGEKRKMLSILHGGWVKEEYAQSHSQTKSPYHSYRLNQSFVELIIDTSNVRGDTLMNPGCHTNGKESYYFKIIMEHDSLNKTNLHMMYNHNYKEPNLFLDYSISSTDTTLFMVKKDMKTGGVKSKTAYKRIYNSPLQNDYAYNPIDIFLNRTIFTGKYKLYDEKNKLISDSIEFNDWGVVKGFPGYDHYYIGSDMFSGFNGNYQTDYIRFVSSDEKLDVLGWNLENGVFTFYDLIINNGLYPWKKSKLKFRMVRL